MIALRMIGAAWSPAVRRLQAPAASVALLTVCLVVLAGMLAPLSGYVPGYDVVPARAGSGPGLEAWLGTDHLGRDVFWRLVHACRAFTIPGVLAAATATCIGLPAGAAAGWRPGIVASALRFLTDVIAAVPRLVLVLLVCGVLGTGVVPLAIGAGLAYTPALSETIRDRVETLRVEGRVDAWRAHGLSDTRILWLHLVALGCGRLIARRSLELFAFVLVLETTLSYIGGFGVQEPSPSWGNMLAFDWGHAVHPVPALAPAAAIWWTLWATTRLAATFAEGDG
ncbi:MAG: peptide/nickel transport system permease protein [Myxococcota bacterium]